MKGLQLRPDQRGLRVALFDLEADIMEVVWSSDWARFTVADVHRALGETRDIAYTTVMTTVARLFEKGLLGREREGRRYVYRPTTTRDAFTLTLAQEVFDRLGDEQDLAAALLVERVSEADAEELARLEALIRARRAALGE